MNFILEPLELGSEYKGFDDMNLMAIDCSSGWACSYGYEEPPPKQV